MGPRIVAFQRVMSLPEGNALSPGVGEVMRVISSDCRLKDKMLVVGGSGGEGWRRGYRLITVPLLIAGAGLLPDLA